MGGEITGGKGGRRVVDIATNREGVHCNRERGEY